MMIEVEKVYGAREEKKQKAIVMMMIVIMALRAI